MYSQGSQKWQEAAYLRGSRLWDAAVEVSEIFSPRFCAVCRAYGTAMVGQRALCEPCARLLGAATVNVQEAITPFAPCPVYAAGEYEYELARSILAYKNSGRTDLRSYLGAALARSIARLCSHHVLQGTLVPGQLVVLVPLPSSRASLRRRGFEPAPDITGESLKYVKALQPDLRFTMVEALRTRSRWGRRWTGAGGKDNRAQKQLGQQERLYKMRGSLELKPPVFGWAGRYLDLSQVASIICDDVVTSGASISEGQRVLDAAGASVLGAATVARVPIRSAGGGVVREEM